ncbi:MAG: TRAP transporter small permease [Rhodobacterales bacterium]|nr:TRAP transporter small permease [Rhodobacterales bacterium]
MGALSYLGAVCGVVTVLAMVGLTTYAIVNRYVFGSPVTWIDELSGYLVVVLVMVGAAEALRRGDHIGVDLLSAKARGPLRRGLDLFGLVAVVAVAVAILISGREMIAYSYDFEILSEGYLEVPMWIPQSFLLLGAAMLLLAAVARLLVLLTGGEDGTEPPAP